MDLRPVVRYLAEGSGFLRKQAVLARIVAHLLVGNPHQLIIAMYGIAVWDSSGSALAGLAAWSSMAVAVELVLQYARVRGTSATLLLLVGWREAWRVRRRWPSDWAVVAAKTNNVQAEVGTSEEPKAPAFRPICDHPKLSWVPQVNWPVISWWVGPPPGRSFMALEATTSILAANISHCQQIRVEFDRASDSHGRLFMIFDEIDTRPDWLPPVEGGPENGHEPIGSGGPGGSSGSTGDPQSDGPPLRLVPDSTPTTPASSSNSFPPSPPHQQRSKS